MSPDALFGEGGTYVPCDELPSPMPDLPDGAIVGTAVGFVPRDVGASPMPAPPFGAIVGGDVGFVPGPCECDTIAPKRFSTISASIGQDPDTSWNVVRTQDTLSGLTIEHAFPRANTPTQLWNQSGAAAGQGVPIPRVDPGPWAVGYKLREGELEMRSLYSFIVPAGSRYGRVLVKAGWATQHDDGSTYRPSTFLLGIGSWGTATPVFDEPYSILGSGTIQEPTSLISGAVITPGTRVPIDVIVPLAVGQPYLQIIHQIGPLDTMIARELGVSPPSSIVSRYPTFPSGVDWQAEDLSFLYGNVTTGNLTDFPLVQFCVD